MNLNIRPVPARPSAGSWDYPSNDHDEGRREDGGSPPRLKSIPTVPRQSESGVGKLPGASFLAENPAVTSSVPHTQISNGAPVFPSSHGPVAGPVPFAPGILPAYSYPTAASASLPYPGQNSFMPQSTSSLPQMSGTYKTPTASRPSISDYYDDNANEEKKEIAEEMFPPGKVAILEKYLQHMREKNLIGLEYLIEIQHNTTKKMPPGYFCLLCDVHIKVKDDREEMKTVESAKGHIKSTAHKLKYLARFFPETKSKLLDVVKPININDVNNLIDKINEQFGSMKIKIVVGHKLFKKKQAEIKNMVELSTHFREDEGFINRVCGRESSHGSLIDKYKDAFEELEKEAGLQNEISLPSSSKHNEDQTSFSDKRSEERERVSGLSSRRVHRDHSPRRSSDQRRERSRSGSRSREHKRRRSRSRSRSRSRHMSPTRSSRHRSRDRSIHYNKTSRHSSISASPPRKDRDTSLPLSSTQRENQSINSKDKEYRRQDVDYNDRDQRVIQYLKEELELFQEMEAKKKRYMNNAEEHPDYSTVWTSFYRQKCREYGGNVRSEYIEDEWTQQWKKYFFETYEKNLRFETNRLMNKHKILRKTLVEFEERHPGFMERKFGKKLPTMGERRSSSPTGSRSSKGPSPGRSTLSQPGENETVDADSVIKTLRLLTALESLLMDLGPQINTFMGIANNKEVNEGFGSSRALIDDSSFFKLLDSARECLVFKVSQGWINDKQMEVSRICIENISKLLEQSKCEKSHILLVGQKKAPVSNTSNQAETSIKTAIRKLVIEQFTASGKFVTTEEINRIVNQEYERVKQRTCQLTSQPAPIPSASSNSVANSSYSTNVGKMLFPSAQPTSSFSSSSSSSAFPNLNVNWSALESAVKSVSSSSSTTSPHVSASQTRTSERVASTSNQVNPAESSDEFDDLTIEDLVSLCKNFKELDQESQTQFLEYMKRLEKTNPAKVQQLKLHIHGPNQAR